MLMLKTQPVRDPQVGNNPAPVARGADANAFNSALLTLSERLTFTQGALVSTLPRGGLQITQPSSVSEVLVKAYVKETHVDDKLTWTALLENRAVTTESVWGAGLQESPFYSNYLKPADFAHAAAAPVQSAVLPGYDGVIHVYRTAAQGPFSDADLQVLSEFAATMTEKLEGIRLSRNAEVNERPNWAKRSDSRQFIYDNNVKRIYPVVEDLTLDERVRQQLEQHVKHRMENLNGDGVLGDRLQVPDSRGDLWTFRAVVFKSYPALSNGPVVFFCLAPDCSEWSTVRATDFQADAELSRLIPALQFMQAEYHRGPTLNEIARTAHLSPFHFHRRFTELLGMTPKHFLLDCQIQEAKRQLFGRQKELADIATMCGFAHQSHFTSRFKQATGLTPTRWRRLAHDWEKSPNAYFCEFFKRMTRRTWPGAMCGFSMAVLSRPMDVIG
jgi:AraC-like DNA-binding protein